MTNSLVGVLLRFHQGTIGIAADIEGMFHQIRVHEEDQDSLRFLWWTNTYEAPPDVYVMQVHIFGAESSPCVANSTLRRVADDIAQDFSPSVIAAIKEISMLMMLSLLRMMSSQPFTLPEIWSTSISFHFIFHLVSK